jgi:glycosyltransferase involved in cell wall biosynthesis
MAGPGSVEVVVSTFNNPHALDLALCALRRQSVADFKLCVADDGSGQTTRDLLNEWALAFGPRLRHIWHSDHGFRKNRILNKAIASSTAEYLIFLDGDCVPGRVFVERHLALSKPDRFCTGGVIRLDLLTSNAIARKQIESGEVFTEQWLSDHQALGGPGNRLKAGLYPALLSGLAEILTPVSKTWNGGNSSTWRINLIKVNGFDENFGYGAEDIELGFRLNNAGIRGRHLRYTAPVLHLEHERDYADLAGKEKNKETAQQVRKGGKTLSDQGIDRL